MQVAQPPRNHAGRAQNAADQLAALVVRLNLEGGEFEYVRPARWKHKATGHHVETSYSYGEGRVRVFLGGGRAVDADIVISGREDDLELFRELFPVSS
jgi:hypothetical protein